MNTFYLKCIKTPSFAQNIGESGLSGVGRNNISHYLLFKIPLGESFKALVLMSFTQKNWRVWICRGGQENLLFKIPLGRDQNTQFCTEHWRIWAFRCGQEQHISIPSI